MSNRRSEAGRRGYCRYLMQRLRTIAKRNARALFAQTLLRIAEAMIDDLIVLYRDMQWTRSTMIKLGRMIPEISRCVGYAYDREDVAIVAFCEDICLERIAEDENCLVNCYDECYEMYMDLLKEEITKLCATIMPLIGEDSFIVDNYMKSVEKRRMEARTLISSKMLGFDKRLAWKVLGAIKELSCLNNGCAPLDRLIARASELGISVRTLKRVLKELRRSGMVFEIREKCYAMVV